MSFSNDENNKIERLQKGLYSRKNPYEFENVRTPISKDEHEIEEKWSHDLPPEAPKRGSIFKKILIGAVLFFTICAGIALYIFYGGLNVISSKNVDIQISGPVSVAGGEELPLQLTIQNANNSDIEDVELTVEYPEGTRAGDDLHTPLIRYRETLGEILSGRSQTRLVKSVLFGEENSHVEIRIIVDYKIKGSNATFTKEKKYDVELTQAPVSLTIDTLKETNSGQNFEIKATITSNSRRTLENIVMKTEYPFGFSFKGATVSPSYNNDTWVIATLAPQQVKTIVITGAIEGQESEERSLRFNLGLQNPQNQKQIATQFLSAYQPITIKKPFIGLNLALNGRSTTTYAAPVGSSVTATLDWKNNLPDRILDAEISISLSGSALDRTSVRAPTGFYRSVDNTVVWNPGNNRNLNVLDPGDSGSVDFSFASLPSALATYEPSITLAVKVRGRRVSDTGVPEEVNTTVTRVVKLASQLKAGASVLYSTGPFKNTGPIPAHADKKTTYTVVWTASNSTNDVTSAKMTALLPPSVKYLNVISPAGENLTWNQQSQEVIWNIGTIKSGVGFKGAPRQVSFQVELQPSVSQINTVPILMLDPKLTATDLYTGTQVGNTLDTVRASLDQDPAYRLSDQRILP